MKKINHILESNKVFLLIMLGFISTSFIRISYIILNINTNLLGVLTKLNLNPLFLSGILLILNVSFIAIYANLIYFTISVLNNKFEEIPEMKTISKLIKRICYYSCMIPSILNSVFLTIHMKATQSEIVPFNFNTIIVSFITSLLLFILLKNIIKAKKISMIIPSLFFIMNVIPIA